MKVNIKKLNERAVIPSYAHNQGDMGMDITAIDYEYKADIDCHVYHTGLAFEIPEGHGMLIFPRSSNRKTDAYLANHVAIIDANYRGEVTLCFKDRTRLEIPVSSVTKDNLDWITSTLVDSIKPYEIGDKIAQLVIVPYPTIEFNEVEELNDTVRGSGGFGSTGR